MCELWVSCLALTKAQVEQKGLGLVDSAGSTPGKYPHLIQVFKLENPHGHTSHGGRASVFASLSTFALVIHWGT